MQPLAIDSARSTASFGVPRLLRSSLRGELGPVAGEVLLHASDPTQCRIFALVDATRVDTQDEKRDARLRDQLLDTARHPVVAFRSNHVERIDAETCVVRGGLTIREVTREVTLRARLAGSVLVAVGTVDRRAFGLRWNRVLDLLGVGGKVVLTLTVAMSSRAHDDAEIESAQPSWSRASRP